MGFWNGRVTFTRYLVGGDLPIPFGGEILEKVQARLIGHNASPEASDGVTQGWAGGDHVLDLTIDEAKNIVDDALHLSIRVDTDKIPGSLLRAYTQMEIDAAAQLNPSGIATKGQKQDAKEAAKHGPRPKRPTAGSAGSTISLYSGTAARTSFTPAARATACSNVSNRCFATRLTERSSR